MIHVGLASAVRLVACACATAIGVTQVNTQSTYRTLTSNMPPGHRFIQTLSASPIAAGVTEIRLAR
jgi:hypothetical protein